MIINKTANRSAKNNLLKMQKREQIKILLWNLRISQNINWEPLLESNTPELCPNLFYNKQC